MLKINIGNIKKNGCSIDNETRNIIYYEYLNIVERFQGKEHAHCIKYDEIFYIEVFSHVINEIRSGSVNIFLKVYLWNGKDYYFPIYFNDTPREQLRDFIKVLRESLLDVRDNKGIFDEILNSNQNIWELIEQANQ